MSPEVLVCPDKLLPEDGKERENFVYDAKVMRAIVMMRMFETLFGIQSPIHAPSLGHHPPRFNRWMFGPLESSPLNS
jgi:hypothetical protein